MRVVDYIAEFVYNAGARHVFMVSGGGMMYLSDGLIVHPHIKPICVHHEQAAAMAALSYAKYNGNIGVAYVTTGCGGTNALTGVLHAWQDSVPCMFISGQSSRALTIRNSKLPLRQVGVQEADIVSIVESITKYAVMVDDPQDIKYHLTKALFLAKTGRPAPVWLDIPLDVQNAEINESSLRSFDEPYHRLRPSKSDVRYIENILSQAKRPVVVCGQGIRISGAINEFRKLIEGLNIPCVASRLGIDILPSAHPLFIGRIGVKGDRAGNFAIQNADVVLAIGSRLSVSSTGFNSSLFAREATVIVVDIDQIEHQKNTVKIDTFIHADAKSFIESLSIDCAMQHEGWSERCLSWKNKWGVCLPEYLGDDIYGVNTYVFTEVLSHNLKYDSVVVSDAGSAFYVISQGVQLVGNQRYITSGGQAEMGYTLPASVGVCVAKGFGEVIGVTGDGSFQMNIQELQTIVHHNMPVKIFVWNNDGYLSIRDTQDKFFDKRYIGTDRLSGVSFPDISKIAGAYGIKYFSVNKHNKLDSTIKEVLACEGPAICEVICNPHQKIMPSSASVVNEAGVIQALPLEDMYPFLSRDEFYSNMIIKTI